MVVFGTVSADVSPDLCKAIPGDTAAKVTYLEEELHEHYPHVLITHNTDNSDIIRVQGQWQEIIDLHSVLDQWYISFLNIEKQKHELSHQQQVQEGLALGPQQETLQVFCDGQLQAQSSSESASGSSAHQSLPDITVKENRVLTETFTSPVFTQADVRKDNQNIQSNITTQADVTTFNTQHPAQSIRSVDDILNLASGPTHSNAQSDVDKNVESTTLSSQDQNISVNNDSAIATIKSTLDTNMYPEGEKSDVNTTLNTSSQSSDLNTSDAFADLEIADIKTFIKSWGGRMRDQEVQTDVPEVVPLPYAGRRRGRKPGSPRKAKAHIPVKKEASERVRNRPERFGSHADSSKIEHLEPQITPRRRRGRPKKSYIDVLPEEMIPVPVSASENVINMDDDNTEQQPPGFDDIELILDERPKDELAAMPGVGMMDPMISDEPNSAVVLPTAPTDEIQPGQRSAKAKALIKVGVMAKDEEGLEIREEKRGRKPKEGPCISREEIDAYLPPEDVFEVGPFKCKLCSHSSKRRAALKQHYLRCHLERKFQCRTCGKRYSLLKELASHKLTHNRRHQCQMCDKKFATQYLLEGHVERRHLNPKKRPSLSDDSVANRQCTECEFVAKSRKSLQDHVDRIHGEKVHPCPVCNKMFALVKDLNQHIKFHSERYQCDECGKSLKSKLALKLHINGIHRGIKLAVKKEYVCEDCGKICRNKTHFKEHVNKEHLHVKPYQCEICPLSFFTKHALKCHGRVHSDIREFICDLCGKGFKNRSGLRVHRITHQDVTARPYVCGTCHKTFTQRGALVRHERIHSGDRPYKCRLCDSSFNDYSILRRHVVGVHKINDRALCGRVDIDPNAINRGRPKIPGPVEHPDSEMLNNQKQAEMLVNAEKQAEMLAHAAMKVAQDIAAPTTMETIDTSAASGIQTISQHPASFQAYVDSHQRTTPLGQRIVQQQPQAIMKSEEMSAVAAVATSQVPTPAHTPGPKDLSLSHTSTSHNPVNQMQPIELITIGGSLDANQTVVPVAHQQHPAHSSTYSVGNMVPISVVSDMVQNVLYEHHHALEGGYTIGMPVFPTPTTVANMHMMQPALQPGQQHTLTHLQQPPQQQAQPQPQPPTSTPNRDRHGHM